MSWGHTPSVVLFKLFQGRETVFLGITYVSASISCLKITITEPMEHTLLIIAVRSNKDHQRRHTEHRTWYFLQVFKELAFTENIVVNFLASTLPPAYSTIIMKKGRAAEIGSRMEWEDQSLGGGFG
jgi:hypothetical protein